MFSKANIWTKYRLLKSGQMHSECIITRTAAAETPSSIQTMVAFSNSTAQRPQIRWLALLRNVGTIDLHLLCIQEPSSITQMAQAVTATSVSIKEGFHAMAAKQSSMLTLSNRACASIIDLRVPTSRAVASVVVCLRRQAWPCCLAGKVIPREDKTSSARVSWLLAVSLMPSNKRWAPTRNSSIRAFQLPSMSDLVLSIEKSRQVSCNSTESETVWRIILKKITFHRWLETSLIRSVQSR